MILNNTIIIIHVGCVQVHHIFMSLSIKIFQYKSFWLFRGRWWQQWRYRRLYWETVWRPPDTDTSSSSWRPSPWLGSPPGGRGRCWYSPPGCSPHCPGHSDRPASGIRFPSEIVEEMKGNSYKQRVWLSSGPITIKEIVWLQLIGTKRLRLQHGGRSQGKILMSRIRN